MNKPKIGSSVIYLIGLTFITFTITSCKESKDANEESKKHLELKEKELALKEKDIKLKEEELLRKREENIEKKENELNQRKNDAPHLSGKYSGTIKDGTYWEIYINDSMEKKLSGYNKVFWEKYPEGLATNFSVEFNPTDNSIIMYEDRNSRGSGTFYGTVSSDGKVISGTWYRYSDGGSFTWNLSKTY